VDKRDLRTGCMVAVQCGEDCHRAKVEDVGEDEVSTDLCSCHIDQGLGESCIWVKHASTKHCL